VAVIGYPIQFGDEIQGAYYIYQDITERKEFEEQLAHQAFHDALTGLPNRVLFTERLGRAVQRAQRREEYRFAVFMIDLNRFKVINDSLGHHAGDQLLVGAARRMVSCVRGVDTVARLGGDEFAILLEEYSSPRDVTRVAQRIHEAMERPFTIEGTEIVSSAAIGIVLKTGAYARAEDILRDADVAMYRAKATGKMGYRVFNKKMHEEATRYLVIENELRQALEAGQLVVHYQPIVGVATQRIEGFEALVRWEHPRRGLIPPNHFIPVAEETGLIVPLGAWVLREACLRMAAWRKRFPAARDVAMSVNVASRQLDQKDLVPLVARALEESGLPAQLLKLELTETTLVSNSRTCKDNLLGLKALGVRLVVDDFGTGYSSLQYLQRMPIDMLKIDRSFICGGAADCEENQEIVKTILTLARNLGLAVVAEGVEEEEQLERLAAERCEQAQGFMFSRPVDATAAERLLASLGAPGGV
jgi:Amt family ammonium transporter